MADGCRRPIRARAAGPGRTRESTSALAGWTSRPASWKQRATTSRSSSPTCPTNCERRLNAISGFSQVLRKQLFGEINEKQAEYLDDILASARHLVSLIDDVLDLSKVEAGQIELEIAPFSLPAALDRGVVIVRERATKEGVRISLRRTLARHTVVGDERRVRQVIFNLLSNAVKFTPAGGTVDVAVARVDGEVRVSVSDSGPGIAAEDQVRIFEEFQQAGGQGAARGDGAWAGALEAPRRAARRADLGRERGRKGKNVRVHAACAADVAMAGEQILMVEDNAKNMTLLRDVLRATGYRTLEASTGGQALTLASEHGPALVLMDIRLPDMDGVEALRRLRMDSGPRRYRCSP